jgi:hypothetical protein
MAQARKNSGNINPKAINDAIRNIGFALLALTRAEPKKPQFASRRLQRAAEILSGAKVTS